MTPIICRKCKRVINWQKQEYEDDIINKLEVPEWDCESCKTKKEK